MNKTIVVKGIEVKLSKREFYCGSKPNGTTIQKSGWIAEWNGLSIGNETRDRGMHWSRPKIEPAYKTVADIVSILEDRFELELKRNAQQTKPGD